MTGGGAAHADEPATNMESASNKALKQVRKRNINTVYGAKSLRYGFCRVDYPANATPVIASDTDHNLVAASWSMACVRTPTFADMPSSQTGAMSQSSQ